MCNQLLLNMSNIAVQWWNRHRQAVGSSFRPADPTYSDQYRYGSSKIQTDYICGSASQICFNLKSQLFYSKMAEWWYVILSTRSYQFWSLWDKVSSHKMGNSFTIYKQVWMKNFSETVESSSHILVRSSKNEDISPSSSTVFLSEHKVHLILITLHFLPVIR
jgi:hypothetical protein